MAAEQTGGTRERLLEEIGKNADAGELHRIHTRYAIELVSSPARWEQEQIETREREQT